MAKYLFPMLVLLMIGCKPCEPVEYDNGPLPDSVLSLIPYSIDEKVVFQHSSGLKIPFYASRSIVKDYFCQDRQCCEMYYFEKATTTLWADYPIFSISLSVNNADTLVYPVSINIGHRGFWLVDDPLYENGYMHLDSLEIEGMIYNDITLLKNTGGWGSSSDDFYTDSLYFNKQSGILKIIMSNGEYYQKVN